MDNSTRRLALSAAAFIFALSALYFDSDTALAQSGREAASGHGTQIVSDQDGNTFRRQFSFSAQGRSDGTARGNAVLHNPAFTGTDDRRFYLQIKITCMQVFGNTAIIAGTTRRTNEPGLDSIAVFAVQDNGEPGRDRDMITGVAFLTPDPNEDPAYPCNALTPDSFVPGSFQPIESGNVNVRG